MFAPKVAPASAGPARVQPWRELVKQNRERTLRESPFGGFTDRGGRRCPGVTKTVAAIDTKERNALAKLLEPMQRTESINGYAAMPLTPELKRRLNKARGSTCERGTIVHHHLAHQLQCVPKGRCLCAQCGSSPLPMTRTLPPGDLGEMVRSGMQFLFDRSLAPVGCELIVSSTASDIPLATRIDGLFINKRTGKPVLIEWKTCSAESSKDIMQVALGLNMLRNTHRIVCQEAHLVYLRTYNPRTFRGCVVHAVSFGAAACELASTLPI
jgi:hypothetical protein